MRAVLQRVASASVDVDGARVGEITEPGLQVYLGITHDDGDADVAWMARKIRELRILAEEQSLADTGGPALIVSQFTLSGDARKGRRPGWSAAAPGAVGEPLYDAVCAAVAAAGTPVQRGIFGAHMEVRSLNDGPFTVIVDSPAVTRGVG